MAKRKPKSPFPDKPPPSKRKVDRRLTPTLDTKIGARIRAERRRLGWSVNYLAERLGKHRQQISALELSKRDVIYSTLLACARAGLRPSALVPELFELEAAYVDPPPVVCRKPGGQFKKPPE